MREHRGHREHHPAEMGRHHGPGPGSDAFPFWGNEEGGGRGRGRGGGGRVRRGSARFVLLEALRDVPRHGYEIIRALEERSSGQYVPSPGMVYPTLQFLEDAGLIASDQSGERRVFHLTENGKTELEAHVAEVEAFWKQVAGPTFSPAAQSEIRFLREEMEHLRQTIRGGLQPVLAQDDLATVKAVRQAVERCRNEVRDIITGAASNKEIRL